MSISQYFTVINQMSVGSATFGFFCLLLRQTYLIRKKKMNSVNFSSLTSGALAIATLPTGLALLFCAFDTSLLPRLSDLHLHIWVAGAAVSFLGITAFINEWS